MAAFEYIALDPKGRQQKGMLEGDSARQVRQLLREVQAEGGDEARLPFVRGCEDWRELAGLTARRPGYRSGAWCP